MRVTGWTGAAGRTLVMIAPVGARPGGPRPSTVTGECSEGMPQLLDEQSSGVTMSRSRAQDLTAAVIDGKGKTMLRWLLEAGPRRPLSSFGRGPSEAPAPRWLPQVRRVSV